MDFDLVLKEIGEFGRYQKTNYLLICLPVIFAAANSLSYIFTAGVPNYRCYIPGCDLSIDDSNYEQDWLEYTVPGTIKLTDTFVPDQCNYFERINNNNNKTDDDEELVVNENSCLAELFSDNQLRCDQWIFDRNERTIVNDWKITCPDNQWQLALIGTLHFAGIVAGSGVFGVLADRYGRKIIFIFCILFMSLTGIGQALSSDYVTFSVFAFLNAFGTSGVYPLAFIIGVEMVGPKKREMSGIVLNYFYSIGEAAVGIAAWLSKDWVTLQLIVSAPPLLFVIYYWFVPESVRWLLAKKDTAQARRIIQKAAHINGVILSDSLLQTFEMNQIDDPQSDHEQKTNTITNPPILQKNQEQQEIWSTFKLLIVSKVMIFRCLILFYIWMTNAFVFYGLSLNSTNLSGNKYLNFILVCLVEIPGLTLAWIAMNKIGRRISLAGSLLICAVTCVAGGFVVIEYTWLMILLFLMGKMGITASFAVVYVHTAEMMPTIIRSGGVGTMSTVARLGALLAPFVPLLSRYFEPLPMLLFGCTSLLGGLLALFLPETLGKKLPDSVEEAELVGKDTNTNMS